MPPTEKDKDFVMSVFLNSKEHSLTTDFEKVARDMGLKDAGIAKVRYGQIKRKLLKADASPLKSKESPGKEDGSGNDMSPSKAAGKRRKAKSMAAGDDDNALDGERPAKKPAIKHESSVKLEDIDSQTIKSEDHGLDENAYE